MERSLVNSTSALGWYGQQLAIRVAMVRRPAIAHLLAATALVALLAGCQRSEFELAPTEGTVTIEGQPLSAGKVMFAPISQGDSLNAGKPAFGIIQPGGGFVLTTYKEGDGAVVGEHWVTIYGPDRGTPQFQLTSGKLENIPQFSRLGVPQKQTIVADEHNRIDIKLTAQDVARFGRLDN